MTNLKVLFTWWNQILYWAKIKPLKQFKYFLSLKYHYTFWIIFMITCVIFDKLTVCYRSLEKISMCGMRNVYRFCLRWKRWWTVRRTDERHYQWPRRIKAIMSSLHRFLVRGLLLISLTVPFISLLLCIVDLFNLLDMKIVLGFFSLTVRLNIVDKMFLWK